MKKLIIAFILIAHAGIGFSAKSEVSHDLWNSLLKKHVSDKGVVDYEGFAKDKTQIDRYLSMLNENPPQDSWSEKEKMAFWINTYNAATVKLIVDNYPVNSIQDLQPTLKIPFIHDVWHKEFFEIGNKERSLNEVEHEILRKDFNEPRIHFAVNCASISCPKLRNEAYTTEKLDEQLTDQAKYFLNNEQYNKISKDKVEISKIFQWFTGDFTKNGSLIDFLNKYSDVQINQNAEVDHLEYNWDLNNKLPA